MNHAILKYLILRFEVYSKRSVVGVALEHLVAVSSVSVAKPLDVVEDQPRERDDHQDDEGDGDEHHRGAAHVLLQVPRADADVHGHRYVLLQQGHDLTTFGFGDHDRHHIART